MVDYNDAHWQDEMHYAITYIILVAYAVCSAGGQPVEIYCKNESCKQKSIAKKKKVPQNLRD